ncbi:MAG TPA: TlpA disulfide reductase family protein [Chryseolinea sp.]
MTVKTSYRVIILSATLLSLVCLIGWVFWIQEVQYSLPTPVPARFVDIKIGEKVDLSKELKIDSGRAAVLHFFNSECPCSRFNMDEFERLEHQYRNKVQFFVVIQSDNRDEIEEFQDKYELTVPIILDPSGAIADKCGIYATPQAVILDQNSAVYFKGNYNKARFCARKETRFVEIALDHLLKGEALPLSMLYAVVEPYGCTLPSDDKDNSKQSSFILF